MPSLIVSALRLTGGDHGPKFCAWAVGTIVSAAKRASAAASFVLFIKNWFFILSPLFSLGLLIFRSFLEFCASELTFAQTAEGSNPAGVSYFTFESPELSL